MGLRWVRVADIVYDDPKGDFHSVGVSSSSSETLAIRTAKESSLKRVLSLSQPSKDWV